jgi:serine/threonine-protein kinase HipA
VNPRKGQRTTRKPARAAATRPAYALARVRLWGHEVGVVAESPGGEITFEYTDAFRRSGLEISPIHLPLARQGPVTFPELRRSETFAGLPGVLADALPDAFGNAVIRRYFTDRGTPQAALSPVQKLLYIGDRAMGALEFAPPLADRGPVIQEALEVRRLVDEARRVIEGDVETAVPEIMQVGASAGGARAKALILWNRGTNTVRSAFAKPRAGDEHWVIKFDGVSGGMGGPTASVERRPGPYGRIEQAYARMARRAGIQMPETHLLREGEFAHFMAKRFDRDGAARIHMHSLGGLQHVDYNVRGAYSYEGWLRTIQQLRLGQPAINEAYRRMVFNLAAANLDDHVKNIAFLMAPDGAWSLAPAFDMTFAKGGPWTRTHQMTLAGKDDGFAREDLLAVGKEFGVPKGGALIIEEVAAALTTWEDEAGKTGVPAEWVARVRAEHVEFR